DKSTVRSGTRARRGPRKGGRVSGDRSAWNLTGAAPCLVPASAPMSPHPVADGRVDRLVATGRALRAPGGAKNDRRPPTWSSERTRRAPRRAPPTARGDLRTPSTHPPAPG